MSAGQSDDHAIVVRVPDHLPRLNPRASRILLAILVKLTTVEAPEPPPEGGTDDY